MTAEDLKKSILQQAIQGKLVPQNSDDEPASAFLERIRAEKSRLVAKNKIKRDKNESIIFRNSDGQYIERIGKSETDITKEIPFEIPLTWTFVRIPTLFDCYQPKTISTRLLDPDGKHLVYGANGVIGKYNQYNHIGSELLLTCRGATCGSVNVSEPYSWINGNAMVIHPKFSEFNIGFFKYVFLMLGKSKGLITGTAQPQIVQHNLNKLLIPLPPLTEQKRIVERINQIFTKIKN